MSQISSKLKLILPELTDEIEYFISSMFDNFQKIDDDSKDYAPSYPTSGIQLKNHLVYNEAPTIGKYVGWVNLRDGMATPLWSPLKKKEVGDTIVPKNDNGHYYICTEQGYTGVTEPIFPVSTDGSVSDTRGANTWLSNHFYTLNDIALPTIDNGRFYVCIQEGESGNLEPNWSNIDGATTYDNNAVWHGYRIARWKENGVAALYRPFGKID